MYIAMVSDNVLPTPVDGWGGLQRVVYDMAMELQSRDHRVDLFATTGSKFSGTLYTLGEPQHSWQHEGQYVDAVEKIIGKRVKYHVIHDHTHRHLLQDRHPEWPIINHVHDELPQSDHNLLLPSYALKHRLGLRRARVLYNGVVTSDFRPYFKEAPSNYLLYMSVISERKGADIAVKAAIATGTELLIAGKTDWDRAYFDNRLLPLIESSHGLVSFIGPLTGPEKMHHLSNAKALILPSRYCEPGSIVVLEAQACGVPVITSRDGCLPEYVEHGVSGFNCGNLQEYMDAINNVGDLNRKDIMEIAAHEWDITRVVNNLEICYTMMARGETWISEKEMHSPSPRDGVRDICVIIEYGSGKKNLLQRKQLLRTLQSVVDNTYLGWYAIVVGGSASALVRQQGWGKDPRIIFVDDMEAAEELATSGRFIMSIRPGTELRSRHFKWMVRFLGSSSTSADAAAYTDMPDAIMWKMPGQRDNAEIALIEYCED